jgi:hypothetical protein
MVFLGLSGLAALWSVLDSRTAAAAGTAAILLALASIFRWLIGERHVWLEFGDDGFIVGPRPRKFCYDDIWGLRTQPAASTDPSYAIEIVTVAGTIRLPAQLTATSREVEDFLRARLPRVRMPADERVRDHVQRMVRQFGKDRGGPTARPPRSWVPPTGGSC